MEQRKNIKNILFNVIMKKGNKNLSEKLILKSFKEYQKKNLLSHIKLSKIAIVNYSPLVYIKTIKKGKDKFNYTTLITKEKILFFLGVKNLLKNLEKKNNFIKNFTNELTLALTEETSTNKKLKEIYEYAFEIKKYANFK